MGQPATAQEDDPYAGNEAERPFLKDGQKSHELQAYPVQPPAYPGEAPAPVRRDTHRSLGETVQKPKWAPPGSILRCYQQANYCTILQWVMSFFVMGTAASVVDKREYLESTKPYSITALALVSLSLPYQECATTQTSQGIWFILTLFFRLRYKAASPSTAKPSTMYVVWTGIYLLLWGAALGCSIALMVIVKPYDGERDTGVMSYDCGKSAKKPCHPFTNRGRLTTNVSILLSFCCAGL
jgi:hypothetical protein